MATQNPKFIRPYMGALLSALLPKLRSEMTVYLTPVNYLLNDLACRRHNPSLASYIRALRCWRS